jgi:TolB protein
VLADGLEAGLYFTVSADGSKLAYTRADYRSNLWRVDLSSTQKTIKPEISRLTSGTSYCDEPSFSPDGRWIAFALGPSHSETNVFKLAVTGGEPIQLTFFQHTRSASPGWSPDGQRIAFVSNQGGVAKVWTISANGGAAQAVETPTPRTQITNSFGGQ